MIADDFACNPRNPRPGTIFDNADEETNLYGEHVEVDYRGYEVHVYVIYCVGMTILHSISWYR